MNTERRCPKCGEAPMRTWADLSDEEREVVRRLPGSADYQATERRSMHHWCTRCWYEAVSDEAQI